MEAFAWIGQIIESLGRLIPRLTIVRATMGGVKWRQGKLVSAMNPGLHIYWPLTTETEIIITARQTLNLPTQVLMTKDRQRVVVGTVVVYRIKDVVQAIGERNWDVDTTISDITKAAIVGEIAKTTLDDLLAGICDETVNHRLTRAVRRGLRQYGVHVHKCCITDFSDCKVYKVLGANDGIQHPLMPAVR